MASIIIATMTLLIKKNGYNLNESEGLAELNKGHGPGGTETGCTEEPALRYYSALRAHGYSSLSASHNICISLHQLHPTSLGCLVICQ